MLSKRLILVSCCVFALFVAAMRVYITQSDQDPTTRVERFEQRAQNGEADAFSSSRRRDYAERRAGRDGVFRHIQRRWEEVVAQVSTTAESLDRLSVRLRCNAADRTVWQLASAWFALHTGRAEAAATQFDMILDEDPDIASALAGKAAALVMLGRLSQAVQAYEDLVACAPHNAEARFNYGALLCRQSRLTAAANQFREVVRIQPEHLKAWHNIGSLAQRDGRLIEARHAWDFYTRLSPAATEGWFNLGVVQMDFRETEDAAYCFSRVIELDPGDILGHVNLAMAYRASGDIDSALASMRRADKIAPCQPEVMRPFAELLRLAAKLRPREASVHLAAAQRIEEQLALEYGDTPTSSSVLAGDINEED